MTHDEIMAMPIEHVSEKTYVDGNGMIEILFHIEGYVFRFFVIDTDKEYYFGGIYHDRESKPCLFCKGTWGEQIKCKVLENEEIKSLLFERLIQSKPIRLNWLYRVYKLD